MSKARRTRAVEAPASPGVHERIVGLLTHRHVRWGGPLAAALVTLLVSAWTFDAKLSISGDNTEFVTLARSLAAGDGLTYTNRPEPRVATKYPFGLPLLLAPMAAAFGGWEGPGTGTPDWVAMKWLVVFTFVAGIGAFYLLARQVAGDVGAIAATALAVTNPLTVSYGHQVMSEVPFLAPSMLALWCLQRGIEEEGWRNNRWLWAGGAAAIVAYHVRSVGIVLISAPVALLLLRRDWSRAGLIGGVSFVAMLPWVLRNSAAGGGGGYLNQLIQVNPYFPERGLLDVAGLWERVAGHLHFYLSLGLTGTLWPTFEATGSAITPGSVAMLALLGGFAWRSVQQKRHLLLPVLLLFSVTAVADGVARLRSKGAGPTTIVLAGVLRGLALQANTRGLTKLARERQADYRPEWRNYFEAGLWLRANSPEDAIVSCRKAFWFHVVSGRRTFVYAFKEPDVVVADLDAKVADYAIVEQLGYSHTQRFLVPALQSQADRFPILWHRPNPATYVVGINRQ